MRVGKVGVVEGGSCCIVYCLVAAAASVFGAGLGLTGEVEMNIIGVSSESSWFTLILVNFIDVGLHPVTPLNYKHVSAKVFFC